MFSKTECWQNEKEVLQHSTWHQRLACNGSATPQFTVLMCVFPESHQWKCTGSEDCKGDVSWIRDLHRHLSQIQPAHWQSKLMNIFLSAHTDILYKNMNAGINSEMFYDGNDSQTVMAHGCYLSDDELNLFKETGASLSHCPNSNIS